MAPFDVRLPEGFKAKDDGRYARGVVYAGKDILKTSLFEGLEVKMEEVFAG